MDVAIGKTRHYIEVLLYVILKSAKIISPPPVVPAFLKIGFSCLCENNINQVTNVR